MPFLSVLLISTAATLALATPLQALPAGSSDRAELFAICSGRLEALAVRQRARMEDEADAVSDLQQEFDVLLEAVLPWALSEGIDERQPNRWCVRGWVEVAHLLADMDYSFDARKAAAAKQLLAHRISECRKVLL